MRLEGKQGREEAGGGKHLHASEIVHDDDGEYSRDLRQQGGARVEESNRALLTQAT